MSTDFNPDKLRLTKAQVLGIIDRRIKEWKKSPIENKVYILEGYAVKLIIKAAPEDKFGYFWAKLMEDIDAVRFENARQDMPDLLKKVSNSSSKYAMDFTRVLE